MFRPARRIATFFAAATLVLAACGGDDSSSEAADLRAQLAELQQELADGANAALRDQLAELEQQISELEGDPKSSTIESDSPSNDGGESDGGVTSLQDVPPPLKVSEDGLYDTSQDAERAADAVGCEGTHQMGDRYMPCGEHGQLDEIEAEEEQAPPAEPAPVEEATIYAPPAQATPPTAAAPATDADAPPTEIEYSIDQRRTNASRFSIMVEASAPGLRTNTLGIKAVCLYQYNEYGTSIHGDPKRPCSRSNGLLASYLSEAYSWTVIGQCGSNGQIKDYYDIGIVAEDGRSLVVRVKDSPC